MAVRTSMLPGGIGVLEAQGSLLGGKEINELREAIDRFVGQETTKLILDVSGVVYVNSAAIGVLVSGLISYSRRNWQIKLCGANKVVYTILRITKLNLAFEYYDTREEAIRSFA
jgi:anti-sigma B factor antagonist